MPEVPDQEAKMSTKVGMTDSAVRPLLYFLRLIPRKVNTKADVRFHIGSADWLNEDVKEALLQQVSP